MILALASLAAILLLLNRRKSEASGNCLVFGQPGFYFTWQELTHTTKRYRNEPNTSQCQNLKRLASNVLDPLREITGSALYVTSGFRSVAVNNATANSVPNSRHLQGKAADIYSKKYNPDELAALVREYGIPHHYMQVYPDHLHISIT